MLTIPGSQVPEPDTSERPSETAGPDSAKSADEDAGEAIMASMAHFLISTFVMICCVVASHAGMWVC